MAAIRIHSGRSRSITSAEMQNCKHQGRDKQTCTFKNRLVKKRVNEAFLLIVVAFAGVGVVFKFKFEPEISTYGNRASLKRIILLAKSASFFSCLPYPIKLKLLLRGNI